MATFTKLPLDEARRLVSRYGISGTIHVRPVAGGSVNSNYRIDVENGESLFVRLYEEQDEEGARWDVALVSYLAARGVPTPCPLTHAGGALAHASGKPAALFPFVTGVQTCQLAVDARRAFAAGAALAKVHVAGAAFPDPRVGRFEPDALRARLPRVAAATDPVLSAMADEWARRSATWEAARAPSLPSGVIHGDLFRDNVLFRDEGSDEIVAIFDFESASTGRFAFDLGVAILAWCFADGLERDLARAMIGGYESVRPLEAAERAGLRAELALGALRFALTRITDYALREGALGARVVKDWRRFWARLEAVERGEAG